MAYAKRGPSLDWLAVWILLSAWASIAGWCLSAFGFLNVFGIVVAYTIFISGLVIFRSRLQGNGGWGAWRTFRSRYVVPRIWLLLTLLAFVGGAIYSPNNYDYLTYRFPRVLYWSWEQGWYWIPTVNTRINYSGTGFEWLMVPLFVVFKTDRLFFLINFVSYLLLPGLVFSVFSNLGISKRISWWWMWLLPCGYCYILQAASVGNDSFAAIYFLASLHYLFKARDSVSSGRNLMLSCLAIALMTEAKASNLPLVLPWLILLFFQRRNFLESCRPVAVAVILVVSAGCSFLPTAIANIHFTGDYSGDPTNKSRMKLTDPVIGVLGNSLQLVKDNLALPISPRSTDWKKMLPSGLQADLLRDFPRLDLHAGELQIEEDAGAGLGVILFLGLFVFAGIRARVTQAGLVLGPDRQALWIIMGAVIAWLAYLSKMGSEATSRLVAAYYPILIAGVLMLVSLDGIIIRRRLFDWVGLLAMASAIPLVILSPARPLFPARTLANIMAESHVPAATLDRYNLVYSVYGARADVFKELIDFVPAEERAIGFLQLGDDPEGSLWRPFGTRKIIEVTPADSMLKLKAEGVRFVVVSKDALSFDYHMTVASLMTQWPASLVAQQDIVLKSHRGPETWYLLRL